MSLERTKLVKNIVNVSDIYFFVVFWVVFMEKLEKIRSLNYVKKRVY